MIRIDWSAGILGAASFLCVVGPMSARALDLEKLVMPGEVIQAHAHIESECSKCHAPFQAEAQADLCIDCHREIGNDIRDSAGFHGRAPGAAQAECNICHGEHEGRDADVVGLDRAAFDHDLTDYSLRGAHLRVACERCHAQEERFGQAPRACVECHRHDDSHRGKLGLDCAGCHSERSWLEARFDHGSTGFRLETRHSEVDCALCHPAEQYANTVRECQGCHRLNDAHYGRYGANCEGCHSPRGWTPSHFDHDRDTRFQLAGRHRDASCEACHSNGTKLVRISSDCVSCHRADDEHRGRNGPNCERCHSERSWNAENFDHARMAEFPLRGGHQDVKCRRCHTGTLGVEKLETACRACHHDDDVHQGQQGGGCGECHNERGWATQVFFEHDLTRFPLLGLHAVAACEQCHATPRYQDTRIECVACHSDEDVHLRRLGPACALCHNPNGWPLWRFEHASQTDFALLGVHGELDCHACHRAPAVAEVRLSRSCHGCHGHDDPHFGAFGRDCARCHGDTSWTDVKLGR